MEARIARLESEIKDIRADLRQLETATAGLRRRMDPIDRAVVAGHIVITAMLLGAMSMGFGWI